MKVKIWGIFGAVVLVAALVVGLAGTVLAGPIVSWYLNDTTSAPGRVMDMEAFDPIESHVIVPDGGSVIWIENEAATQKLKFPAAEWETDLFFLPMPATTVNGMTVYIGTSDGTASSFISLASTIHTGDGDDRQQPSISVGEFELNTGHYIAFKLDNNTGTDLNIDTGRVRQSRITGPQGKPGVTEIEIEIDIKPTSCPNPLNVGSGGVLPVAILGTEDFDVTQVDPNTVQLEGVPPSKWALEDVAAPDGLLDCEDAYACSTDGPDGFMDMTFKFKKKDVVDAGDVQDGQVLCLTLTGNLWDGTPIEASDVVIILKKK